MDIYSTIKPEELNYMNKTNFFKDKPINFLFKFNNNSYKLFEGYTNINILVDSGAYYFNALGRSNEDEETFKFITKYIDFIEDTLDDSRIKGYFDMDLRYIGLDSIKKIRRKLFKITDKIIPVYHLSWGEREFKQMCKKYNYIGFPCATSYNVDKFLPFVKYAHKHHCKIHGLGLDRDTIMNTTPFNSTDSALWIRRSIAQGYYWNHNIPKNLENNLYYTPIYVYKGLLIQMWRQNYYERKWANYHKNQSYGGKTIT